MKSFWICLCKDSSLLVTDLAEQLNVSSVTIRKDLTELERAKKLYRNHGKAILIDPYSENRNISDKEKLCVDEKRAIGSYAAGLVTPKDSILIASGTTMHALRPKDIFSRKTYSYNRFS